MNAQEQCQALLEAIDARRRAENQRDSMATDFNRVMEANRRLLARVQYLESQQYNRHGEVGGFELATLTDEQRDEVYRRGIATIYGLGERKNA